MSVVVSPRRVAAGSALLVAVAVPALGITPTIPHARAAQALPVSSCATSTTAAARSVTSRSDPGRSDSMGISERVASRINQQMATKATMRSAQRIADGTIAVPIVAHVLVGKNKRHRLKRAQLNAQIQVLNNSYSGLTGPNATNTPFRFYLKKVKRTHNERWFTISIGSHGETHEAREMKKKLHKGGKTTLNLYFVKLSDGFLGYSSFPWSQAAHPKLDGVVIDYRTAFGNRGPYSEGDTATHEVGHWLGLLHPFEGGASGCNADPTQTGDFVVDTPPETAPTSGCPEQNTSCPTSTGDVHNFMDYAYDSCMYMFTSGQADRMSEAWVAFRS